MQNDDNFTLSIHQAVGNLAILSDFDIEHPYSIGVIHSQKFITDSEILPSSEVLWFSEENMDAILQGIKNTYHVVLEYLKEISSDQGFNWTSPKTKQGISEIMALAGKVQDTIDLYLNEVDKVVKCERIGQMEVYLDLVAYFQKHIQKKFEHPLEGDEEWEESWVGERASLLDMEKSGLKSFDTVKNDLEYELFYLKNAEGDPFFRRELLRNIELYCDFDQDKELKIDDPLLKITLFKDKNYQGICDQLLRNVFPLLAEFYQKAKTPKDKKLYLEVNKVIMAIMLTSNPKNLVTKTKSKSSTKYFEDFQVYLNRFLSSKNYNRNVSKDSIFIEVIHAICYHFFLNKGGVKEEIIGFIHFLMRRGLELAQKVYIEKEDTVWNRLMKGDDQIRFILKHFPNGPLFKILDAVREKTEGFYPLLQENTPKKLYELSLNEQEMSIIKIPSPTKQTNISEAQLAPEFLSFLRGCKKQRKRFLMVVLQDRTSWKEHARTKMIEALSNQKEFKKDLFVVTFSKDTEFYQQAGSYRKYENSDDFIEIFKDHLLSGEDYGYFFQKELDTKEFRSFIPKMVDMVWDLFYEKRSSLSRKNRQDFIEVCYHFLLLKILEIIKPDAFSLSCKDGIDTGSVFSASFYAFLSLLKNRKIDEDFLRYLLYSESLLVRERAVNFSRLSRMLSFLAYLEQRLVENRDKKIHILSTLFKTSFIESIDIES